MKMSKHHIQQHDLALAWAISFAHISEAGDKGISPFMVTVTGFTESEPQETQEIRGILDSFLVHTGNSTCHTVANTIFPESIWNINDEREQLYSRYRNLVSRIISPRICNTNKYGIYFDRLIDYQRKDQRKAGNKGINQLEHIINTFLGNKCKPNHRHSALIATIFNPEEDHTNQRQRGFPCMHEVTFEQHGEDGLGITGFYATQYFFNKAYGNILGLCRLGRFMAHALGRQLVQVNCIASVAQPMCPKYQARELLKAINPYCDITEERLGGLLG
jgi:hypothetical protein